MFCHIITLLDGLYDLDSWEIMICWFAKVMYCLCVMYIIVYLKLPELVHFGMIYDSLCLLMTAN